MPAWVMRNDSYEASIAVATAAVPLRCFADAGAKLGAVDSALRLEGNAGLGITLRQAKVEAVGEPLSCPPKAP